MRRRIIPLVAMVTLIAIAAPAGVAASGDRPNSCAAGTSSPTNRWLSETLSSSIDVDWFRFNAGQGAFGLVVARCRRLTASMARPAAAFGSA